MNAVTKNYKTQAIVYLIASIIITFGPLLYFTIKGFILGSEITKFTMGTACTVSVILFAVNILTKHHLRSPMWVLLVGIYFALKDISGQMETLLIILAATTILDEFWFTPAFKHCKSKYSINKEIDKRGL